jgi:hypothetical protein
VAKFAISLIERRFWISAGVRIFGVSVWRFLILSNFVTTGCEILFSILEFVSYPYTV